DMPLVVELGLVRLALAKQSGVRVGRRSVRGVAAALPVKVDRGIAWILGGRPRGVRALEALETSPGLDQGAVDGEMLIGQHVPAPGFRDDALEEGPRDV